MSDWQPIETVPVKREVLLCWTWPGTDAKPIIRTGSLLWEMSEWHAPIFKLEIDYGDAGAWVYTAKDDVPTHWMALPEPPASGIEAATAGETGTGSTEGESPVGEAGDAQTPPEHSS